VSVGVTTVITMLTLAYWLALLQGLKSWLPH